MKAAGSSGSYMIVDGHDVRMTFKTKSLLVLLK